ncbi:AMP-binding protein [Peristeroidobacter agariperforans]|uniref:AMP-binding protein n=1 Tax=Peristeroidobacter agariperforans TaxID=268404 RepID=UPI00101B8DC5|nr:AMP-binding protein [Peristeroidobacter agariperforans]
MTHHLVDYAATCAGFEWPRPEKYNFAGDVVDRVAQRSPEQLALLWIDDHGRHVERTFKDVSVASKRICNVLASCGVRRGDVLVLILPRIPQWWEVFTACLRMGVIVAPGTTQLSATDIKYRLNSSRAVCVVTDDSNAAKVDQIASDCPALRVKLVVDRDRSGWIALGQAVATAAVEFDPVATAADENAICYFTSGTTGYPKMCMHTHCYALGHINTGRYWLDLRPEDLHWNISDTGWAKAAWSSYFGPWLCGATVFVHHTSGFSAKRSLEILQRYPITTLCGAPTIYRMFVQEDLRRYRFSRLRHCVGAGEPLNPEVIQTWREATGLTIRDGYGQTETALLCGSFPGIEPRYGSMGKPAPGIELRVLDDEGQVAKPQQEGDVAVRIKPRPPQGVFKEYMNDPERTAQCLGGEWYRTGDRARVDEDGYFWFVGRADDVILSAGYRIGPFEVESALIEHAAVAESAVVSSPDGTRGEVVKAFVVLAPGHVASEALVKELQEHVKAVTAPYKYPRKIEFVASLPKTVSGKIRRAELRQREWGATA